MSAPYIILLSWPSLCQKLSKLVEIWRSSDENNFGFFFGDTVYSAWSESRVQLLAACCIIQCHHMLLRWMSDLFVIWF